MNKMAILIDMLQDAHVPQEVTVSKTNGDRIVSFRGVNFTFDSEGNPISAAKNEVDDSSSAVFVRKWIIEDHPDQLKQTMFLGSIALSLSALVKNLNSKEG